MQKMAVTRRLICGTECECDFSCGANVVQDEMECGWAEQKNVDILMQMVVCLCVT